MYDDNWDLINGPDAHAIEVLNYANQINVIEALIRFLMHHDNTESSGCAYSPNAVVLKELHRTGTLFLLQKPGEFREVAVEVRTRAGIVVYDPPMWQEVSKHVDDFMANLMSMWASATPIQISAYTLWKLNWIHPFKNGNGRSARAFSYACLSLKLGFSLPGSPTIIDYITTNRQTYESALKDADLSFKDTGTPDLTSMEKLLEELLIRQFSSIATEQS